MALGRALGALVTYGVAVTRQDPSGAMVVLGGYLLPQFWPLTVGKDLYWTAWWILLMRVVMAGAADVSRRNGKTDRQERRLWSWLRAHRRRRPMPGRVPGSVLTPGGSPSPGLDARSTSPESRWGNGGPSVAWTLHQTTADRRISKLRRFQSLEEQLAARIVGQDHAAAAIARTLLRRALDASSHRPLASVLATGPTGVGKTETAKALAEILGRPLLIYDMTSFGEPHTVAALIGAPPGYAGAERCGRLVADIQRHPDAVVLLDEIDKAHPALFDPFMQVLEDGRFIELSRGEWADFTNTVIIATTNLLQREAAVSWTDNPVEVRRMLLTAHSIYPGYPNRGFGLRAELVSRLDIVLLYKPLSHEIVTRIALSYVPAFIHRTLAQLGICPEVTADARLVDDLVGHCDLQFGMRELKRITQERLGDALVDAYLPLMFRGIVPATVEIQLHDGQIVVTYR